MMERFIREIYPVGHGGFAFERIGNYSVVFDCGSKSIARISKSVADLKAKIDGRINRLYISHFDKDHVDGIRDLVETIGVDKAVIPYIPETFRVVYNAVTDGAYSSILDILSDPEFGIDLEELERENVQKKSTLARDNHKRDIWEWISKPMLCDNDWQQLSNQFERNGLDARRLSDPYYVALVRGTIKDCFNSAFKGSINAKGLILLSQNIGGTVRLNEMTQNGITWQIDGTAALYLGDADVKAKYKADVVKGFLNRYLKSHLAIVQIPHHGSPDNSSSNFIVDFPARFCFYNDISSLRLQRNSALFNALTNAGSLLEVRDVDSDTITHIVEIQC